MVLRKSLQDCLSDSRLPLRVVLRLRPATLADRSPVRGIRLSTEQELFAGAADSVFDEIETSSNAEFHHPFVVECRVTVVGFLVVREAGAMPPWAGKNVMTVHAVRVDAALQGRGVGRFGLAAVADWARATRPSVRQLMLAVNARNRHALLAYLSWGFCDTGLVHDGPIGRQIIFSRPL